MRPLSNDLNDVALTETDALRLDTHRAFLQRAKRIMLTPLSWAEGTWAEGRLVGIRACRPWGQSYDPLDR